MTDKTRNNFAGLLMARYRADTPPFFKKLRLWGLILTSAGCGLLTLPFELPVDTKVVAGYILVAGCVMTAVSQAAVPEKKNAYKKARRRGVRSGTATNTKGNADYTPSVINQRNRSNQR